MAGTISILPDPPLPPTPVGLIAGEGRLPVIVAEGLLARGHPVHALGLSNLCDSVLPRMCPTLSTPTR